MKAQISSLSTGLKQMLYPKGSVATIRFGQLRGYRFMVSSNSGWSPIIGRWEPGAHKIYAKILKKGDVAFDLGANAGLHSMVFSILVGDAGRVFSFEPLPDNCEEIQTCIKINDLKNITIVNAAVGAASGQALFDVADHGKQGHLSGHMPTDNKTISVSVVTIDEIVKQKAIIPDFIKFDIEGTEGPALIGAHDTLRDHRPVLSIELHTPEQDVLVGTILSEAGYDIYRFEPASFSRPKLTRIKSPKLGWPEPSGTWGTILALHASKKHVYDEITS